MVLCYALPLGILCTLGFAGAVRKRLVGGLLTLPMALSVYLVFCSASMVAGNSFDIMWMHRMSAGNVSSRTFDLILANRWYVGLSIAYWPLFFLWIAPRANLPWENSTEVQ